MTVQTLIKDIPSPKLEKWKFSNLPGAVKNLELTPGVAAWDMTGAFDYLDPSLRWEPPKTAEPSLWTLNADQPADTLALRFPKGRKIDHPIHLTLEGRPGELTTSRLRLWSRRALTLPSSSIIKVWRHTGKMAPQKFQSGPMPGCAITGLWKMTRLR